MRINVQYREGQEAVPPALMRSPQAVGTAPTVGSSRCWQRNGATDSKTTVFLWASWPATL